MKLWIAYKLSHHLVEQVSLQYFYNTQMVFELLCAGIILLLGIVYILMPVLRIEDMISNFKMYNSKSLQGTLKPPRSRLEVMFLDILHKQKESIEREHKADIIRKEAELSALQSKINPHFLYNTLDSIRGFALLHGVNEIADMTEALSRLFRNMIAKEGQLIKLEEELENVENYMIIQQFRFNNKFVFTRKFENDEILNYKVPNLTIQPIVENAIMHGLEKKSGKGEIKISAYATKKRLVITVFDNGIGIPVDKLDYLNDKLIQNKSLESDDLITHHTGIALVNINQRIKLRFGDFYGLHITSTVNLGTEVEVVLPLLINEDLDQLKESGNSRA